MSHRPHSQSTGTGTGAGAGHSRHALPSSNSYSRRAQPRAQANWYSGGMDLELNDGDADADEEMDVDVEVDTGEVAEGGGLGLGLGLGVETEGDLALGALSDTSADAEAEAEVEVDDEVGGVRVGQLGEGEGEGEGGEGGTDGSGDDRGEGRRLSLGELGENSATGSDSSTTDEDGNAAGSRNRGEGRGRGRSGPVRHGSGADADDDFPFRRVARLPPSHGHGGPALHDAQGEGDVDVDTGSANADDVDGEEWVTSTSKRRRRRKSRNTGSGSGTAGGQSGVNVNIPLAADHVAHLKPRSRPGPALNQKSRSRHPPYAAVQELSPDTTSDHDFSSPSPSPQPVATPSSKRGGDSNLDSSSSSSSVSGIRRRDPASDESLPCPRLCGAVFSPSGLLVYFNNVPVLTNYLHKIAHKQKHPLTHQHAEVSPDAGSSAHSPAEAGVNGDDSASASAAQFLDQFNLRSYLDLKRLPELASRLSAGGLGASGDEGRAVMKFDGHAAFAGLHLGIGGDPVVNEEVLAELADSEVPVEDLSNRELEPVKKPLSRSQSHVEVGTHADDLMMEGNHDNMNEELRLQEPSAVSETTSNISGALHVPGHSHDWAWQDAAAFGMPLWDDGAELGAPIPVSASASTGTGHGHVDDFFSSFFHNSTLSADHGSGSTSGGGFRPSSSFAPSYTSSNSATSALHSAAASQTSSTSSPSVVASLQPIKAANLTPRSSTVFSQRSHTLSPASSFPYHSSGSVPSHLTLNVNTSIVIMDLHTLMPVDYRLAFQYVLSGSSASAICVVNRDLCQKFGRTDLASTWSLAASLVQAAELLTPSTASPLHVATTTPLPASATQPFRPVFNVFPPTGNHHAESPLKSSAFALPATASSTSTPAPPGSLWSSVASMISPAPAPTAFSPFCDHAFGGQLADALIARHLRMGDLQTVAMLTCVFDFDIHNRDHTHTHNLNSIPLSLAVLERERSQGHSMSTPRSVHSPTASPPSPSPFVSPLLPSPRRSTSTLLSSRSEPKLVHYFQPSPSIDSVLSPFPPAHSLSMGSGSPSPSPSPSPVPSASPSPATNLANAQHHSVPGNSNSGLLNYKPLATYGAPTSVQPRHTSATSASASASASTSISTFDDEEEDEYSPHDMPPPRDFGLEMQVHSNRTITPAHAQAGGLVRHSHTNSTSSTTSTSISTSPGSVGMIMQSTRITNADVYRLLYADYLYRIGAIHAAAKMLKFCSPQCVTYTAHAPAYTLVASPTAFKDSNILPPASTITCQSNVSSLLLGVDPLELVACFDPVCSTCGFIQTPLPTHPSTSIVSPPTAHTVSSPATGPNSYSQSQAPPRKDGLAQSQLARSQSATVPGPNPPASLHPSSSYPALHKATAPPTTAAPGTLGSVSECIAGSVGGLNPCRCIRCNKFNIRCVICDIAVKGLMCLCVACGHGGHPAHIRTWFAQNSHCPTGCGCDCRNSMP